MNDTFVITVNIDGCRMQMKIPRADELAYRNAAKVLNERIFDFRQKYTNKDVQTILKMVALECAVENQMTKIQAEDAQLQEKLKSLSDKINKSL